MKFGISVTLAIGLNPTGNDYIRLAQHGEALGFNSFWIGEHIVIPKRITSTYPYTKDGSVGFHVETPWLDVLAMLTAVGACTKKILLGTGVIVVPYRHPVDVAKTVATADLVSNGRILFGVGTGWLREEFETLGIPFNERGVRTDEALRIMKAMWTGGDTTFKGRIFSVPDMHVRPLPVQKPHPPIIIGGKGPATYKRTAALGDGWYPGPLSAAEMLTELKLLAATMTESGRKMSELRISMGAIPPLTDASKHEFAALEEAGVEEIVLNIRGTTSADTCLHAMEALAKTLFA